MNQKLMKYLMRDGKTEGTGKKTDFLRLKIEFLALQHATSKGKWPFDHDPPFLYSKVTIFMK